MTTASKIVMFCMHAKIPSSSVASAAAIVYVLTSGNVYR